MRHSQSFTNREKGRDDEIRRKGETNKHTCPPPTPAPPAFHQDFHLMDVFRDEENERGISCHASIGLGVKQVVTENTQVHQLLTTAEN
jgi:hypothetical protein